VTEFQAREAHSSFDLTKAKHSIDRLPVVENEKKLVYEWALVITLHMGGGKKRKIHIMLKI
jgi:hypothetical protein